MRTGLGEEIRWRRFGGSVGGSVDWGRLLESRTNRGHVAGMLSFPSILSVCSKKKTSMCKERKIGKRGAMYLHGCLHTA